MAFPSVRSSRSSFEDGNLTTHTVDMPLTIENGDLLFAWFVADAAVAITWDDVTFGTWTDIVVEDQTQGHSVNARAKIADGTEDSGSTLDIVTSGPQNSAHNVLCIKDWFGALSGLEVGTLNVEISTTTPDPPSLTASWGAEDNLWIAIASRDQGSSGFSVWPFADTNLEGDSVGADGVLAALCTEQNAVATNNPSTFTHGLAEQSKSNTLVVRPAAAGGGPVLVPASHSTQLIRY